MLAFGRIAPAILLALLGSTPAMSASRLIFPRVLFQSGRFVGFAIANPTTTDAAVTFKAYNLDGSLFGGSGATNPPPAVTIKAGSQYVRLAWQPFLPGSSPLLQSVTPTRVWVEVTADIDGLTGFFLEGNDTQSFIDGADLTGSGTDLILPVIDTASTSVTEIAIVNPNSNPANLLVDLVRANGSLVAQNLPLSLPSKNGVQGPIGTYLGVPLDGAVAARIRSDIPVVCVSSIYRQPDGSFVTLAAQDTATAGKTLYFPQLAQGAGWATSVGVVNTDTTKKLLVTFTAYDDEGKLYVVNENPATRQVDAGGVLRSDLQSLFGFPSSSSVQTGWLKVETSQASLLGYVEYTAGGRDRAVVLAQYSPVSSALFSYQVLAGEYFTGMAVLNPGTLAANCEIVSFDGNGVPFGKAQRVLKPLQKETKVISEWIAAAGGRSEGGVFVKSSQPVIVTQLFGTASAVANVPPQPAPSSFNPGQGIANITVTPPLAVVETGKTQQFLGAGASGLAWTVSGGTSESAGTVSGTGTYTAPSKAPAKRTVTVQATAGGNRSGGATIDIVQREALTGGLTLLTSVAYLQSTQAFFLAEQQLLSSAPYGARAATASNARISQLTAPGAPPQAITTISNETIAKMIEFVDGGTTYLLMAGFDSGKIYRMNTSSRQIVTVASGLQKPNSLAIDTISGDLFVSESGANQIVSIPRSQVVSPTGPDSGFAAGTGKERRAAGLSVQNPQGIAVDACSGTVYYTQADGTLHEYSTARSGDRTLASGLSRPTQIQVLYRESLPCSNALTLAVVESDRLELVDPWTGLRTPFIGALQNALDITFLSKGNPFVANGEASLGLAEGPPGTGASRITEIPVGGMYGNVAPATPPGSSAGGAVTFPYADPVGDTVASSASKGFQVHDVVSVSGQRFGGNYVITVKLNDPMVPLTEAMEPNGISAFILVDQQPGTGGSSFELDPAMFNPLRLQEQLGWESLVDLTYGMMYSLSTFSETPVSVTWGDTTITVSIPESALNLATAKIWVVVSNEKETTDYAPNLGSIKLAP